MNPPSRGPAAIPDMPDITAWRARALYLVLIVLAIAGLFAYGSTILGALLNGQVSPLLWVYAGVYVGFLVLGVVPALSVQVRAWLVFALAYTNAAASFARVGLAGSGRLYLIFIPVAAVILVGARAGWICLALSLGLFAAFGVLADQGVLDRWLTLFVNPRDPAFWIEAGTSLAVFLITMTVLIERFFTSHLRTLETSRRVAHELENAYEALERRVETRTRELSLLNSVTTAASGLVELSDVLAVALRESLDAFGFEAGGAYGLADAGGTLVLLAHAGHSEAFIAKVARLPMQAALAGRTLTVDKPLLWNLDDYPEGELKSAIVAEGMRTVVGVPLSVKGRLVGGLVLNSRGPRAMSGEEEALLVAVGRQIGLAVENARLLDAERDGRVDANRRREVAEGLRETLAVLNSHRPVQEILQFIVAQACRIIGSDAASLMQLHADDGRFHVSAACGIAPQDLEAVRFARGRGGPGRAIDARQPVAIPDVEAFLGGGENAGSGGAGEGGPDPEEAVGLSFLLSRGYRALLVVPLFVRGEGFGGITLYYRSARQFDPEEVQLATSLAGQASLALENARLHEEAEAAAALAERNRLARELHDSVTQSLYSVTLYAEAAARQLGAGQAGEAAGHLRELGVTAREALREMRLLIFELTPPALEKGTLADALQIRLDAVESRGGVAVGFHVEGTESLAVPVRRELYQVAQEALNNALKHSRGQSVKVRLAFTPRTVTMEIADDGEGFDPEAARRGGGVGLRSMRERMEKVGGSLAVTSAPGGAGTVVRATAPQAGPVPRQDA